MKKNPISTRRIFPSSQVPPSSFITYAVIVLIFVLFISFMLFRTSSQQDNLINMNSRLIELEQTVQKSVQSSEVTVESLADDLKDANREIRKLWDLSNKRNKVNIQKLSEQTIKIEQLLKSLEDEVSNNQSTIINMRDSIDQNISNIQELDISADDLSIIRLNLSSIDTQLMLLDDTVQALNNYKNQLNQTILEIQTQINTTQSQRMSDEEEN